MVHSAERRDFLSMDCAGAGRLPSPAPPGLALAAKGATESFASAFAPADRALERLDALLPARDPVGTLSEWLEQLREDEIEFLELGSEEVVIEGKVFQRFAARGSAWAASARCGHAPSMCSALARRRWRSAGLAPRSLFKVEPERPLPALLASTIGAAAADVATDLAARCAQRSRWGTNVWLGSMPRSAGAGSVAADCGYWGPSARAELARGAGRDPPHRLTGR